MSRQGVAQKADMDAAMAPDDMKGWRQTMGPSQRAATAPLGVSSTTMGLDDRNFIEVIN
jgi:hypothetical protein